MRINLDVTPDQRRIEESAHNRLMSILRRAEAYTCTQFDMPAILPYEEFKRRYPTTGATKTGDKQKYTRTENTGLGIKESINPLDSITTKNELLLRYLVDAKSTQIFYLMPKAIALDRNNTLMVINHSEGQQLDEVPKQLRSACIRSLVNTVAELHQIGITHNDIKGSDFFWSRSTLNDRVVDIQVIDLGSGRYSYFNDDSLKHPALQELVAIKQVTDIENAWDRTVLKDGVQDPILRYNSFAIAIEKALAALDILCMGKSSYFSDNFQAITLDYDGGSPTLPLPVRDFDAGKLLVELGFNKEIASIKKEGVKKYNAIIPIAQAMKKQLEDIYLRHKLSVNRSYIEKLWQSFFLSHGLVLDRYCAPVGYKNVDPRLGFPKPESSALNYDQAEFSTDFRTAYKQLTTGEVPKNLLQDSSFPTGVSSLVTDVRSAPQYMYRGRLRDLSVLLQVILKDILKLKLPENTEEGSDIRSLVQRLNATNQISPDKIITLTELKSLLELNKTNEEGESVEEMKHRYEVSLSALRKLG